MSPDCGTILEDPDNVPLLAQAINRLIGNDEVRTVAARTARATAEQYDWRRMAAQYPCAAGEFVSKKPRFRACAARRTPMSLPRIAAFATKGSLTNEEMRLRELLKNVDAQFLQFDKSAKSAQLPKPPGGPVSSHRKLIVMEGTGLAGRHRLHPWRSRSARLMS